MTNENEIRSYLSSKTANVKIKTVKEVGSTNDEMKKAAIEGEEEISVLIAESQTSGKGSKGRSFFSPGNTGCYMSILLRPKYTAEECTLLTSAAAAATALAIEKVTGKKAQIKWVNDIYMSGKKVAGILTESSIKKGGNGLDFAVVGIGVNISPPENGFPEEIQNIAGSVLSEDASIKNRLIAEIINIFADYYSKLTEKTFLPEYKKRLFFLNQEITVIEGDISYTARAIDIDSMCRLKVITKDGNEKTLCGGEISIRPEKFSHRK